MTQTHPLLAQSTYAGKGWCERHPGKASQHGVGGQQPDAVISSTDEGQTQIDRHKEEGKGSQWAILSYEASPKGFWEHEKQGEGGKEGRHAKASRNFGHCGTQTMKWSGSGWQQLLPISQGLKRPNIPADLLRPSLLELYFVHCPHSPFYVFYSHKTLVKTKIMPDCILQLM